MIKTIKKGAVLFFVFSLGLTGCGTKREEHAYEVSLEPYEKITHDTVDVMEGDLCPSVELRLTASEQKIVYYHSAKDDMTVKSYNVERGDVVSAGQVLVTFDNEDMDAKIAEYETRLAENRLLLEHCKKMIKLGSEQYSEKDIKLIQNEISVCSGYLQEYKARKESYSISAEGNGVVSSVSSVLAYGHVDTQDELFSITYGDGCYYAETSDSYPFEVGKNYMATYGNAEYEMKLVSVTEPEDNPDRNQRKLLFEYQSREGEIPLPTSLDMVVKKTELKNVIYVPQEAVINVADEDYVSVMGEGGFGYQRKVQVENYVEGYAIISEGLIDGISIH